jgi:hypothetical protein
MSQMHDLSLRSSLTLNNTMRKVQLLGRVLTKLESEIFACTSEHVIIALDGEVNHHPPIDPDRGQKLRLVQFNISADRTESELALEQHIMPYEEYEKAPVHGDAYLATYDATPRTPRHGLRSDCWRTDRRGQRKGCNTRVFCQIARGAKKGSSPSSIHTKTCLHLVSPMYSSRGSESGDTTIYSHRITHLVRSGKSLWRHSTPCLPSNAFSPGMLSYSFSRELLDTTWIDACLWGKSRSILCLSQKRVRNNPPKLPR